MLDQLKGIGTVVACALTDAHRIELVRYADESWAIRRDGHVLGVWEAHDQLACSLEFIALSGIDRGPCLRIAIRSDEQAATAETPVAAQPSLN